jgi:hypothetical protein
LQIGIGHYRLSKLLACNPKTDHDLTIRVCLSQFVMGKSGCQKRKAKQSEQNAAKLPKVSAFFTRAAVGGGGDEDTTTQQFLSMMLY